MTDDEMPEIRDAEHGIIDAMKLLLDTLIRSGAISRMAAANAFNQMADQHLSMQNPEGAFVLHELAAFARDEAHAAEVQAAVSLLRSPPEGSA